MILSSRLAPSHPRHKTSFNWCHRTPRTALHDTTIRVMWEAWNSLWRKLKRKYFLSISMERSLMRRKIGEKNKNKGTEHAHGTITMLTIFLFNRGLHHIKTIAEGCGVRCGPVHIGGRRVGFLSTKWCPEICTRCTSRTHLHPPYSHNLVIL